MHDRSPASSTASVRVGEVYVNDHGFCFKTFKIEKVVRFEGAAIWSLFKKKDYTGCTIDVRLC